MIKKTIFTILLSLSLIIQVPEISHTQAETTESNNKFSRIEQPLPLKLLVTLGGLGLIGAEIWWFFLSKNKSSNLD